MILPNPSVSPLHSFASTPTVRRSPSFGETLGEVMRWLTGKPRKVSQTDRLRERRIIEALADEIEADQLQPLTLIPPRPRRCPDE